MIPVILPGLSCVSPIAVQDTPGVIRYEDAKAMSDLGLTETRVVRLAAIKP